MPYVETGDGTRLFYSDWGTGSPVVFVSSWGLSSAMWDYQRQYLISHGLRCVAYDRRGHGRSDQPGRGYDFDTLADDLAALIEHLDLRDVTLVGHSMGGGEVVRYLTRHSAAGRVVRAVLLAAITPLVLKTEDNPDGVDGSVFEAVRSIWSKDFPRWVVDNAPPYIGAGLPDCTVSPEVVDWTARDLLQTSLPVLIACNHALTETDFRAEMRSIRVPVLVIHGDHDQSTPLEVTGRKSAALIPGSRLVVYENAPHGLYLTHMDRLNRDLLAFAGGEPVSAGGTGPVHASGTASGAMR